MTDLATYKITKGYWRATMLDGRFSNIHHQRDGWHADIRNARGELVRYAGIWPTLRAALDEVAFILERN